MITPAAGGTASLESEHEVVRVSGGREKRNTDSLAGGKRNNLTGDEDMFTWYDVDVDLDLLADAV